ncbi:MAG: glycosyltransferase [DPANN group archaeon]|nr:glycosyltransferase [DPANN group archaeon]
MQQSTDTVKKLNSNEQHSEYIRQMFIDKILQQIKYNPDDMSYGKKPKSVVLLSSEYLPKNISEIALHCKSLADGLVDKGINVNVITPDPWKDGQVVEMGGVKVHYINNSIKSYSPLTWALTLNMEIGKAVSKIVYEGDGPIDLIHAHQWEMFPSALMLQSALKRPLVVNYYSTQEQRTPFVNNLYTDSVKNIEYSASNDSDKIHVHDCWLKSEVMRQYSPKNEKVNVLDPSKRRWTSDVVRDYKWVMQNCNRNNGH